MRKRIKRPELKPSTKAIALTDIEVISDDKTIFSCKKDDIITFKDIVYKNGGNGYLLIDDGIELRITAFKII